MNKTLEISINKIRKISAVLLLRRKTTIVLLAVMLGSLALAIYCIIIGNFVDADAFEIGYTSLSFFAILLAAFSISVWIYLFKKIKGKGKTIVTYEYEFSPDNVLIRNLTSNVSFILNKNKIRGHCVISDVLVVSESYYFFFPNDEATRKEIGISK